VPATVLASPATRARQTAEIVCLGLGADAGLVIDEGLYSAEPDDVVARLRLEDGGPVMVVGHNPTLHELALGLLTEHDTLGADRLAPGLSTSALAVVDLGDVAWSQVAFGRGTLKELFVPPR
jgi:phosphohistidine phosphatase